MYFLVGEAEQDGDCNPLGGGGDAGEDLVEILQGGSFTRPDWEEEELETEDWNQHQHGLGGFESDWEGGASQGRLCLQFGFENSHHLDQETDIESYHSHHWHC